MCILYTAQGDPMMVMVPPEEQFRNYYCFPVPATTNTYVQLIAEEDDVGGMFRFYSVSPLLGVSATPILLLLLILLKLFPSG